MKKQRQAVEILIVEDSRTQAAQLQHMLKGQGYAVNAAANGREALEMLRQHRSVLVVSDIIMPEMDGYSLCRAIKSDAALKNIPVILVTALSDTQDVVSGLECGADNFIRKPYEASYLLSRIEYLLMNLELRKSQKMHIGVEIELAGKRHFVSAERQQILDLLISTYEQAIHINEDLKRREQELAQSNQTLNVMYGIADGLNRATSEQEVMEAALDRALELPGILAGWFFLRRGESGFRIAATRNLPPALSVAGSMDGECRCSRHMLAKEADAMPIFVECERLAKATGDTRGLRYHACVPIRLNDHSLGIMNLVAAEMDVLAEAELKALHGVGSQVAVALERARLFQHLEQLVEERTAKLTAEISERQRIEDEQARLVAIIDATPDFVGRIDLDGRMLFTNEAGWRMLGYQTGSQAPVLSIDNIHPAEIVKRIREESIPYAGEHGCWKGESMLLTDSGRELPVSQVMIAHKVDDGEVQYFSTIMRDISAQKENEQRILRLNRVYAVISGINMTIVRVHDRQKLFDEACHIAVEHGQFRLAWIGLVDAGGQTITPMAKAGFEDGFFEQLTWLGNEGTEGMSALARQAVRDNRAVICNDVATAPQAQAWREGALQRGYASLALFPLAVDGKVVSLFALHAAERDFFDSEELHLLVEIAGDIAFALDHIEKEERLNYLAYYDALTGLPNRTLFCDRLNQFLHLAEENEALVAVLAIDLERFHVINETLGRHIGDELLKLVAERLCGGRLEKYHLGRIDADSFAVVLDEPKKDADVVRHLETDIFSSLSQPFVVDGNELRLAAQAGIALFPNDGKEAETLFGNAEVALKKAKHSGERYRFYTSELNATVTRKLQLENKLRRALEQEQFVLHYQPKVSLKSGEVAGLEALIRWQDPENGMVSPVQFIPFLEESGMILDVGRWALDQAIADMQMWLDQGLPAVRVAVNVSSVQLRQKDFVKTVEKAVTKAAHKGECLELEITESMLMQDIETQIKNFRLIREMGVKVAIDDFGTGYSSLSYITRLPVNTLKIDASFIRDMTNNPDNMAIVSTIISLAHSLDMQVVAEGVEMQGQQNLLHLLKCDEMQGYLFSPGVTAAKIPPFLKRRVAP